MLRDCAACLRLSVICNFARSLLICRYIAVGAQMLCLYSTKNFLSTTLNQYADMVQGRRRNGRFNVSTRLNDHLYITALQSNLNLRLNTFISDRTVLQVWMRTTITICHILKLGKLYIVLLYGVFSYNHLYTNRCSSERRCQATWNVWMDDNVGNRPVEGQWSNKNIKVAPYFSQIHNPNWYIMEHSNIA